MKRIFTRKHSNRATGFTRLELVAILVFVGILAALAMLFFSTGSRKAQSICCNCNLKQIGIAYRVWANDHFNKNPAEASIKEGGWKNYLTNQNSGSFCWTNYSIMQNELGLSTVILVCPADERRAASDFKSLNNISNISYFVGAGADSEYPQAILGGDRNLGRGFSPDPKYGFSPVNDTGNDVAVQTNSKTDPISWSVKMHSKGNATGMGNILLADASVQQATSQGFRTNYQPFALDNGNWPSNHVPTAPSFRLIFP